MRYYGQWAGNPEGTPEQPTKCVMRVWSGTSFLSSQCARKRGHGPGKLYCKQHAKMLKEGKRVSAPPPLDEDSEAEGGDA